MTYPDVRVEEIEERAKKALEQFGGQFSDAARERGRCLEEAIGPVKESLITAQNAIREVRALSRDIAEIASQLRASLNREAELRPALEWYGENARLCRLVHSEGDKGRNALASDGGKRARAALQKGPTS